MEGLQMLTDTARASDALYSIPPDLPRDEWVRAGMARPRRREDVDDIAGCSNSPELIAELRRRGLDVPCERIKFIDRDGQLCRPGVYHFTNSDRSKVNRWKASRKGGMCNGY